MQGNFLDITFPEHISSRSEVGISFRTRILSTRSGFEARKAMWHLGRGQYNIGPAVRSTTELEEIMSFFRITQGRLFSFRFRDWNDHQAKSAMPITISSQGTGANSAFQLVKSYVHQGLSSEVTRVITKPRVSTVSIFDSNQNEVTTEFSIDGSSGKVLSSSLFEAEELRCDFEFDIEARFSSDELEVTTGELGVPVLKTAQIVEVAQA